MASDYKFVATDTSPLVSEMVAAYETITGVTVQPASPERLFILWVADVIVQLRTMVNYAANQNLPSRASGANLDALGELFYDSTRPGATPATCKMQVNISEAQSSAILIPKGARFTDKNYTLLWDNTEDVYVAAGETSAEITLVCETAGAVGNGYVAGQINTLVDISDVRYYDSCANTTATDGGAEAATAAEYYALLRASEDAYSVAGPMGAYEYWAKSVSTNIADVKAIRPTEKITKTLTLYAGHAFYGGEHIKKATVKVYAAADSESALVEGTDYTLSYADNLLVITAEEGGALADAESLVLEAVVEKAGHVHIFALMKDGSIATPTIKELIQAACSDDTVRPLTDYVQVQDPGTANYNIDLTYYIQTGTETPATEIQTAVEKAVDEFKAWQSARLGRDINPSKLISLLMQTGIKRVVITAPVFTKLSDGGDGTAPEIASCGTVKITNGGYEDE